ncbi:SAM-dependent methyltransferase [Asanoa sp. WMMD1127]|uniref:SAM-dependent methyltransferase n=1 Tax=Asanoa sp. WMMD1127 TaxID=3016107 RepID=UPI002417D1B2|nr:SAM-dependent methyltransferase [Asanoa sp. WMMD1127]MDG4826998.1 SAM-dependent methyltransferase [Asanoa sp. WMMD1127]
MDVESTGVSDRSTKPATAARIYDYFLDGVHNFPADREAAARVVAMMPSAPAMAKANRAFLRRAVRHLAEAGVRQFLDLGSGMPTQGSVHEIVQEVAPESRVVYVDIDPIAVSESLDLIGDTGRVTAIQGDMRQPRAVLDHPVVLKTLDFDQPVALLLCAVLHFVPDDDQAYGLVDQFRDALAPGSYVLVSHGANEGADASVTSEEHSTIQKVYNQRTATPAGGRTREGVARFFGPAELVDPGIVWVTQWRPQPDDPTDFADDPRLSCVWAGVGRLP